MIDRDQQLSIIIPVYNEAGNFGQLWRQVRDKIKSEFVAYVVYDFDGDDTLPVVRDIQAKGETRLRLLKNSKRGVVGAICTGFNHVKEGPVVVIMADLSDDLGCVDQMISLYRRGYDVVAASRYMRGGKLIGGPPFKQGLSRLAGVSLHYLRGVPTHDATNAFKLYDKHVLDSITIESNGGFELSLEIIVKAFLAGFQIAEVPATWTDRISGASKFRLWAWLPSYLRWYLHAFSSRAKTRSKAQTQTQSNDLATRVSK